MSLSTIVAQLTDVSWANIAIAAKQAMITAAIGGGRLTINGRDITRISIKEATDLYNLATAQAAIEADSSSGGLGIIQYGERV